MKYTTYAIIGLLVVFVGFFVFLGPSIFGSAAANWEIEKQDMLTGLKALNDSVTSCNMDKAELASQLEAAKTETNTALTGIEDIKTECASEKKEIEDSFQDKEAQYIDEAQGYRDTIKNAANNICCKAKIDNRNINYYKVEDKFIKCLESGENQLNCW